MEGILKNRGLDQNLRPFFQTLLVSVKASWLYLNVQRLFFPVKRRLSCIWIKQKKGSVSCWCLGSDSVPSGQKCLEQSHQNLLMVKPLTREYSCCWPRTRTIPSLLTTTPSSAGYTHEHAHVRSIVCTNWYQRSEVVTTALRFWGSAEPVCFFNVSPSDQSFHNRVGSWGGGA